MVRIFNGETDGFLVSDLAAELAKGMRLYRFRFINFLLRAYFYSLRCSVIRSKFTLCVRARVCMCVRSVLCVESDHRRQRHTVADRTSPLWGGTSL